jgi:hypothetical protein
VRIARSVVVELSQKQLFNADDLLWMMSLGQCLMLSNATNYRLLVRAAPSTQTVRLIRFRQNKKGLVSVLLIDQKELSRNIDEPQ